MSPVSPLSPWPPGCQASHQFIIRTQEKVVERKKKRNPSHFSKKSRGVTVTGGKGTQSTQSGSLRRTSSRLFRNYADLNASISSPDRSVDTGVGTAAGLLEEHAVRATLQVKLTGLQPATCTQNHMEVCILVFVRAECFSGDKLCCCLAKFWLLRATPCCALSAVRRIHHLGLVRVSFCLLRAHF